MTARRLMAVAGASVLGLALISYGTANAATSGPAAASTGAPAPDGERVQQRAAALADRLPSELRADLQELAALEPSERRAAAEEIRDAALAGKYGEQAQQRAQRLARRVEQVPQELRADLQELAALEPSERRAAAEEIRDAALTGAYGEQVKQRAEWVVTIKERVAERRAGPPLVERPLVQRFRDGS